MSAVEWHLHFCFGGEMKNQGPKLQLVSLILKFRFLFKCYRMLITRMKKKSSNAFFFVSVKAVRNMWTRIYFSWAVSGTPIEQQKESEPHCQRKMSSQTLMPQSNNQNSYELLSTVKNLFTFENMLTEITLNMIPTPSQNVQTVMLLLTIILGWDFQRFCMLALFQFSWRLWKISMGSTRD